ncbi:MAG: hypothetical protein IJR99_07830 [Kiritimatiellae bacterium]|nr:hypothetical protein [Kiritimatiellia bacterium]
MLLRRQFVKSVLAFATASSFASVPFTKSEGDFDETLVALLADPHVGASPAPGYMQAYLSDVVAEILRVHPLPRHAVLFGDLAWLTGFATDYRASAPALRLLEDAGVKLVFGMGNHDRRASFLETWPGRDAHTMVPGRLVTITSLPHVDLLMLDTLTEGKIGVNPIMGGLGKAQQAWLAETLPAWPRPVILCAHHPLHEISFKKGLLSDFLLKCPCVCGYIHGHNHRWLPNWVQWSQTRATIFRTLGLPSTGFRGDIGYAMMRVTPHEVSVRLHQTDFWYPGPNDPRPLRKTIARDNNGQTCTFPLPSRGRGSENGAG